MKRWFTEHRPVRLVVIIVIVGIVGLGTVWGIDVLRNNIDSGAITETNDNGIFFLSRPVMAVESTFLDEEAGVTAYTNLGTAIDLSMARAGFKTIEEETADYIVGSMALPDLPETEDVHCFVHSDGWIVTYYLAAEPASKIIGWVYSLPGNLVTKLKVGIDEMCTTLETTAGDISYYHFDYPLANRLMVITDCATSKDPDSFNLNIPGDFTIYERSWSHYADLGCSSMYAETSIFRLNGSVIDSISDPGGTHHGTLTFGQLGPDVFHTATVDSSHWYSSCTQACIGIVLVYFEP
jgi:hypothetical protein